MLQTVNKQAVARAFSRAAPHYQQYACLQRLSGEALAAWAVRQRGQKVLDAGCGAGWFSQRWRAAGNHVTALDLSAAMLEQARLQRSADVYQQGDIEALPFAGAQFDLCWSNLAVQWCSDLRLALNEFYRVTRPGGQILFSTLAEGSLSELSAAWRELALPAPVNRFLSPDKIREAGRGLAMQLNPRTLTMAFPDVLSALRSLKGIGATHLHQGRSRAVLNRRHLQQLSQHWPQDSRGYLLSYQLSYGVITPE